MKKYRSSPERVTLAYVAVRGTRCRRGRVAAVDAGRIAVARVAAGLPLAADVERLAGVLAGALLPSTVGAPAAAGIVVFGTMPSVRSSNEFAAGVL